MDFGFYIKLFVRRLPYFLILLVLGTVLGVSVAAILPPVYFSQATMVVENEQIPDDLAASTVQTGTTEALQIIRQRILTRERLLELADKFDIYSVPGSDQRSMTPDDIVRDLRRRIEILTSGGDGRGQPEATLVSVGFSAPSGPLSANVTNEIVTQILDANLALRRGATGQTLDFFTAEVERLDRELAQREADLLAFQEKNLDALPDSLEFRRTQQSAAQERLQQLQREASILRDRRNRLVTLYEDTGQVLASQEAPRSENEIRLSQAREDLAVARTVLAGGNPRLRMLESRIEAMAQIVGDEQAARAGQATGQAFQLSTYEIQLSDIDGQLESIAKQQEELRSQLQDLQVTIEATPANAIRLRSMQRDYEAVQLQYEQAGANRARAETGDVIENLSKGQRITVIEPAIPPLEPSSPNRPLIAAAGVGAGFMMGVAVIVLLELLNSAVRRPADLQNKLGFVAFGTLPLMRSPGQQRRRRAVIGLAFLLVAVGVPVGLWYVHTTVIPLELALERLLDKAGLDGLHLPI